MAVLALSGVLGTVEKDLVDQIVARFDRPSDAVSTVSNNPVTITDVPYAHLQNVRLQVVYCVAACLLALSIWSICHRRRQTHHRRKELHEL